MSTFCANCGAEMDQTVKFCEKCGSPVQYNVQHREQPITQIIT